MNSKSTWVTADDPLLKHENRTKAWLYSSVVQHLPGICEPPERKGRTKGESVPTVCCSSYVPGKHSKTLRCEPCPPNTPIPLLLDLSNIYLKRKSPKKSQCCTRSDTSEANHTFSFLSPPPRPLPVSSCFQDSSLSFPHQKSPPFHSK